MKKQISLVVIILLFLSFFAVLNWNSFNAPFERDEGEYAYSAWLLRSEGVPYQDSFLQKPPLIVYTYLIGQIISPWAVWPPRVLAALFVILTSCLVGVVAVKEWGKRIGIFSAFLFLPLVTFPPLTPFAANTEKFMILPLMGLVALFVYFKNRQEIWVYVLAGFLATVAVFYKPICLPVVLFIIIFWLIYLYRSKIVDNFTGLLKPFLLICGSGVVFTSLLLLPFVKVLSDLFQEVFVFNFSYVGSFGDPLANLFGYLAKFFRYWWVLLLLLLGFFKGVPRNILYYFALLAFSLLAVFSTPIGHYYLMLMPFLALLCGALLSSFLKIFNDKQKNLGLVVVFFVICLVILFPFRQQFFLSSAELSEWVYGTVNPFGESQEVASHLAEVTNSDDLVFVAGSEPQIYYYAQRKSSSRFIITYPLNLSTPYQEQFQKELVDDLENNPPKAIVFSQRSYSGLWNEGSPQIFINYFMELVSKNYKVKGGYVWVDGVGRWQEPINEDLIPNASLLLLTKTND